MTPSQDDHRRYDDREIALVLKRAAELEDRRTLGSSGKGMTLAELEQIAQDVGLDPDLVAEAALELDARRGEGGTALLGPPATRKASQLVSGQIDEEGFRALVEVVDRRIPEQGIVTAALGTVRWTGKGRFKSTQVSIAPAGDGTRIQATQRFREQVRPALQLVPGFWGAVLGLAVSGGLGFAGGPVALLAAGGAAVGFGIGLSINNS